MSQPKFTPEVSYSASTIRPCGCGERQVCDRCQSLAHGSLDDFDKFCESYRVVTVKAPPTSSPTAEAVTPASPRGAAAPPAGPAVEATGVDAELKVEKEISAVLARNYADRTNEVYALRAERDELQGMVARLNEALQTALTDIAALRRPSSPPDEPSRPTGEIPATPREPTVDHEAATEIAKDRLARHSAGCSCCVLARAYLALREQNAGLRDEVRKARFSENPSVALRSSPPDEPSVTEPHDYDDGSEAGESEELIERARKARGR